MILDTIKTNTEWNIYLDVQENRGMIHHQLGNYTESNKAFLKALPLEHKRKNYPSIASILQQLAVNYERMGEKAIAIKYMKDSLKIREQLQLPNNEKLKAQSLSLYANMLFHFRDIQQADKICDEITEIAELTEDETQLVESLLLKVKILLAQGLASEAQQTLIQNYLDEIHSTASKLKTSLYEIRGQLLQKDFLQKLGKEEEILPLLQEILTEAKKSKENQAVGEVLEQFGFFYHKQQDFKKA